MDAKKILILAAFWSTSALADGFSASVGGDYSTGKYGSRESTDVYYMPLALAFDSGVLTYKLSIPYIRVTGPGDIVPGGFGGSSASSGGASSGGASGIGAFGCAADKRKGASKPEDNGPCAGVTTVTGGGGAVTATGKRKRTTESGLGDIVASVNYNVLDQQDTSGWIVDVNGRVKFGTASDSRGLGSGKTDYAVGVNVDKYFGAPYVSAGLGYKVLGEPRGVNYDNVVYGALGGGYQFSKDTSMGVSYDWATAAVDGASRPQEVSIYASHRINDQYKLGGVLYSGLSNASSDVGGGVTLSYYF
ncbi:MAG: hypothetical protein WBC07_04400 [Methylotenera sp.]